MATVSNMDLKDIIEIVQSGDNQMRIQDDTVRYTVYNGKLKDVVANAIGKEFTKSGTIEELTNRIIPINVVQKIIDKLAGLYIQSPNREPRDKNPADQELIDLYSQSLRMNRHGKIANRYVKLHKHALWEPFLDREGIPRLRTLPSQQYTPISTDPLSPERPTIIVKLMRADTQVSKQRFAVWSDESFVVVDGEGRVDAQKMLELNNPEGINPFGKLPFVYIAENDDGNLIPISDDDLITMQIVICLLLTDLAFASKYQLWSVIALKGAQPNQSIEWNPNSVIKLPAGVDIEAIKPQLDTMEALAFIEQLIGLLLTTKNLSVGDISGTLAASNSASGIAKIIDKSETTEDRLDQEQFFRQAETELWDLFAHTMLPVWVQSGQINPDFVGKFSEDFQLSVQFVDPKPTIGDQQLVELEIAKLNHRLTTRPAALRQINPDLDESEIEELEADIEEESKSTLSFLGEAKEDLDGSEG